MRRRLAHLKRWAREQVMPRRVPAPGHCPASITFYGGTAPLVRDRRVAA